MKLEMTYYFAETEFVPGYSWAELETIYVQFRENNYKYRLQFKNELLYLKKLLAENNHSDLIHLLEEELSATRLDTIEKIKKFINIMLPIIEKYDYNHEIIYEPLKAFKYMLDTYIIPEVNVTSFNVRHLQHEGDTYIAHLLKDLDYIEQAFTFNEISKIQQILEISRNSGVYILESPYGNEFIQFIKEEVS